MNFSRLFCITLSNNFILLYRASASSEVLLTELGFGSCEETSPVALFVCLSWESLPFSTSSFCAATSLCSIFLCLRFAIPAKYTASRSVQKLRNRFIWRRRSKSQTPVHLSQLSLLLKLLVADCRVCQHGSDHRTGYFLVPFTSNLQMAAETVLHYVVPYDHRLPGGPKGSRSVRAPGDSTWGRQLLWLWLGEHGA